MIRQLACSQVIQQLIPSKLFVIFSVRSEMLETNKRSLLFNFGEDLSCVVILPCKLFDLIKNYNDFVNDPVKRGFSEDFVTISDQQGNINTTCKSMSDLSFMIDNQTV